MIREYRDPRQEITIRTPEHVAITVNAAGIGSRGTAFLLDLVVLAAIAQNVVTGIAALFTVIADEVWATAVAILIAFGIPYLYFFLSEWLWAGQTLGKRAVRIRVLRLGGHRPTWRDSAIRNLFRALDFLPFGYAVGIGAAVLDRWSRRVGDLVAGTIVVHDDKTSAIYDEGAIVKPDAEPMHDPNLVQHIPSDLEDAMRQFFARAPELAARPRQELAFRLARMVEEATQLRISETESAEGFLAHLIALKQQSPETSSLELRNPHRTL